MDVDEIRLQRPERSLWHPKGLAPNIGLPCIVSKYAKVLAEIQITSNRQPLPTSEKSVREPARHLFFGAQDTVLCVIDAGMGAFVHDCFAPARQCLDVAVQFREGKDQPVGIGRKGDVFTTEGLVLNAWIDRDVDPVPGVP